MERVIRRMCSSRFRWLLKGDRSRWVVFRYRSEKRWVRISRIRHWIG